MRDERAAGFGWAAAILPSPLVKRVLLRVCFSSKFAHRSGWALCKALILGSVDVGSTVTKGRARVGGGPTDSLNLPN